LFVNPKKISKQLVIFPNQHKTISFCILHVLTSLFVMRDSRRTQPNTTTSNNNNKRQYAMTPMEAEPADVALPEQSPLACGGGAEQQQLKEQQQSQRQSTSGRQQQSNRTSAAQSSSFDNSNINRSSSNSHEHALSAVHRNNNTSKVECLALKMETRRAQRINVTWDVRNRFLRDCRKIAPTRIPLQALLDYREAVQRQVQAQKVTLLSATLEWLGFRNTSKVLLQVLDRAVIRVQDEVRHDWFYYQDFSYYFTKIESQWPFLRNAFYVSLAMLAAFYIGTAVLFCSIMQDHGVCPRDINGKWYSGWLTAIYFASSTMSTVGYGDVSVMIGHKGGGDEPPAEKWRIFVGALYMIVSLLVVILAFSNVVNQARSSSLTEACSIDKMPLLSKLSHYIYGGPPDDIKPGELLQDKVRRVRYAKFGAISTQFFVLNLLGMFANRFFILYTADNEEERWTWMETFYWSIQTTTTMYVLLICLYMYLLFLTEAA
jgi:Ion channel